MTSFVLAPTAPLGLELMLGALMLIVLMLGLGSSLFTALFVTRVIFDLLIGKGIIKDRLIMLHLIRKPNVNWIY